MPTLRIATRGSAQAFTQATIVADALRRDGHDVDLVVIETLGDRTQSSGIPLHSIGGQGVFVKEVQRVVLENGADIAVHSAKDLPSETEPALQIAAFTQRRTPADALVGSTLAGLASGATVATGSVRRRAQLRRVRPDLRFEELRGNIHTRLDKVPVAGAVVIAVAALEILGLTERIDELLDPHDFVPAVGQGCVAVECRADDERTSSALARIDHPASRRAVEIERAFLAELGSGCSLPVGAFVDGSALYTFLSNDDAGLSASDIIELVVPSGDVTSVDAHAENCDRARLAARRAVAAVGPPSTT